MTKIFYACPTLRLFHIMGMKWSVPIIELLSSRGDGSNFNYMHMILNSITSKELSKNLNELRTAGMVSKREVNEGRIKHTTYSLTARGRIFRNFIYDAKQLGVSLYNTEHSCPGRQCSDCVMFKNA